MSSVERCPAFQQAIDRMVNHLTVAGLSKSTAINYVRALRDLQERTGKMAEDLSRDELLAYLAARRKHRSAELRPKPGGRT